MPRKFFKRYLPDHEKIRNHQHLKVFGTWLHNPNLWHLNRRSVAGAFGVGLFMAFVPVPFQMILAAAASIAARVNLPLSVGLVWISNPLTMPPLFYGAYRLGAWLMNQPVGGFNFELSWEWLANGLASIWQPFLLGCFVAGTLSGILGYVTIRLLWRWHVVRALQLRRARRRQQP